MSEKAPHIFKYHKPGGNGDETPGGSGAARKRERGAIKKQLQMENLELRQKKISGMLGRLELKLSIFTQKK